MLTASGFLGPGLPAQGNVLEASAFNSSGTLKDSGVIAASSHEETRYVIPLGTTFGIKLFTDGVIVASLSDIYTETGLCCPAAEAGLRPGDYLLEADSKLLESNTELARIIGASEGRELRLKVRREDEVFETSVTPVYGDGSFKTGMWVRDTSSGTIIDWFGTSNALMDMYKDGSTGVGNAILVPSYLDYIWDDSRLGGRFGSNVNDWWMFFIKDSTYNGEPMRKGTLLLGAEYLHLQHVEVVLFGRAECRHGFEHLVVALQVFYHQVGGGDILLKQQRTEIELIDPFGEGVHFRLPAAAGRLRFRLW